MTAAAGPAVRIKKSRPKLKENGTKKQRLNRKKKTTTTTKTIRQKTNKQRRRESHPGHLQVQATPWPMHHTAKHTSFEN